VPRDRAQEFPRRFPVLDGPLLEGLDETEDGRQRGLDLVGDVGHEIHPHALQLLEARDVVEDEQGLAFAARDAAHAGDGHVKDVRGLLAEDDLLRDGPAGRPVLIEGLLQIEVAERLQGRLARDLAVALPDEAAHPLVEGLDLPVDAQQEDPVHGAREGRLHLGLFLLEGVDPLLEFLDDVVDVFGQQADLVGGTDQERAGGLAPAQPLREPLHLADRRGEAPGKEEGRRDRQGQDHEEGPQEDTREGLDAPADLDQRAGQPDVARDLVPLADRQGHVLHLLAHGLAVAHGRPLSPHAGLLDLGPVEVAPDGERIPVGLGDDCAIPVDDGHAGEGDPCDLLGALRHLPHRGELDDAGVGEQFGLDLPVELLADLVPDQEPHDPDGDGGDHQVGAEDLEEKLTVHHGCCLLVSQTSSGVSPGHWCRTLIPVTM